LIIRPNCSVPSNEQALARADWVVNLTNAIPLDLPSSGCFSNFTALTSPNCSNNAWISFS
jgi:hypothetical protein